MFKSSGESKRKGIATNVTDSDYGSTDLVIPPGDTSDIAPPEPGSSLTGAGVSLVGTDGNDLLSGGAGDDTLIGGFRFLRSSVLKDIFGTFK